MEEQKMRNTQFWLVLAIALTLMAGASQATTTFTLTQDALGTPIAGDTINASPGQSITLYCIMDSSDPGNTFEVMVGYDLSTSSTYGAGTEQTGGRLALLSGKSAIISSINSFFDVFTDPQFAGISAPQKSVVMYASGREDSNSSIGGRPYGFAVRGAKYTNTSPGKKALFSFTLRNDMTVSGQDQYVVVSKSAGGKSFASAWKYGLVLDEDDYALKIHNASALPVITASNKAVLDAIMTTAAPNYLWVLWGVVSNRTATTFDINDGSGVIIHVTGSNSVANGNYVGVKGTLTPSTHTLASQSITVYRP
jgi:hypothetical protein